METNKHILLGARDQYVTRVSVISASAPSCFSQSVVLVRHCAIVSQSISGPLCKHAASSSVFFVTKLLPVEPASEPSGQNRKNRSHRKKKMSFLPFFFFWRGEVSGKHFTSPHGRGRREPEWGVTGEGEECDTAFRYRHTREVMNVNVLLLLSLTKLIWHCSSAAISTMSSSDNN